MNRDYLLKLKEEALLQIAGTYFNSKLARWNGPDAAMKLTAIEAMHAACCRDLSLAYFAERRDGVITLVEAALDELSSFVKLNHDTNANVRAAIGLLRDAVRKGGAA